MLRGGLGRGYCGDGRIKFIVSLVCVVGFLSPFSLSLIKVEEPIVVVVISANTIQFPPFTKGRAREGLL